MIGLLRRYLVAKLAAVVLGAVVFGFAVSAMVNARAQLATMERLHRTSATALARSLAAGVRNTMLTGNGIHVRALLDDTKAGIGRADVRVFAPNGEEVFSEPPPPPAPAEQPAHVRRALAAGPTPSAPEPPGEGVRAWAISNDKPCRRCHAEGDVRGVLSFSVAGAPVPLGAERPSLDALSAIVQAGFVQIMTGRQDDDLDDYFEALAKATPGLSGVAVYNTDQELFFGDEVVELAEADMKRALTSGPPFTLDDPSGVRLHVTPLDNAPRCRGCHEDDETVRGAFVVAFDPAAIEPAETLSATLIGSLRAVMLAGLGRMVVAFLRDVAATGVVSSLTLHDARGALYADAFYTPDPPAHVKEALRTGKPWHAHHAADADRFTFVDPLVNDIRCQSCHGTDRKLRGVIEVTLDTSEEHAELRALRVRSGAFGVVTMLVALLLLYTGLRYTVLRPVRIIGDAAERIGAGDLGTRVILESEDEMGRLGSRINDMTEGLRHKTALSKFVSRGTLETVQGTSGDVARGGERRRITVVFSDIRGFTAYAETRQPEAVVDMLNAYLHAQTDVVARHGGDVDKFVGDELMARFAGDDQAARAVRCAVELITAVEALNTSDAHADHALHVGVGVSTGDMVLGPIGAEERMDFTVIGDAVNLGARLCSNADPGQVLVSATCRAAAGALDGIAFDELDPIRVKGKTGAVRVYAARKV